MIKASLSVHDLRRKIYPKWKADSAGTGGVESIVGPESAASWIGRIKLWVRLTRKRSAGNLHAAFEVAGDGNRIWM
jgi:hypothetical protein